MDNKSISLSLSLSLSFLTHIQGECGTKEEPDQPVVSTKSKILEIIQFIMDVRLDLRITNLLVIYRKHFQELEAEIGGAPSELNVFRGGPWSTGLRRAIHVVSMAK